MCTKGTNFKIAQEIVNYLGFFWGEKWSLKLFKTVNLVTLRRKEAGNGQLKSKTLTTELFTFDPVSFRLM